MRVVIISPWFGEKMGYIENCLPPAMAALGVDVHLLTSDIQAGFEQPNYKETLELIQGPALRPVGTRQFQGFTLHRLPHYYRTDPAGTIQVGTVTPIGLTRHLRSLRPDVVQMFGLGQPLCVEVAVAQSTLNFKLFTGCHMVGELISTLMKAPGGLARLKRLVGRTLPGRFVSSRSEKCYAVAQDAYDIAAQLYQVPLDKLDLLPLGVNTEFYHPLQSEASFTDRQDIRSRLGIAEHEIACIYTGRFNAHKNPLFVARAIHSLRQKGLPYVGVFIGGGEQAKELAGMPHVTQMPYVATSDLARYYRAADIAVWPFGLSSSQTDALACGTPVVVSDLNTKVELKACGALMYTEGDPADLEKALLELSEREVRLERGRESAEQVAKQFSWAANAAHRLRDYELALSKGSKVRVEETPLVSQ